MDRGAAEVKHEFYSVRIRFADLRFQLGALNGTISSNINFIHSIGSLMIRLSVVTHRCRIYCCANACSGLTERYLLFATTDASSFHDEMVNGADNRVSEIYEYKKTGVEQSIVTALPLLQYRVPE
jgi:hypothetical protein